MKNLLVTFVLVLICASSSSAILCVSGGMVVRPGGSSIPLQPRIFLEGWGDQQAIIEKIISGKIPLVLKSAQGETILSIIETHNVHDGRVQIILSPVKPLLPGNRYTLLVKDEEANPDGNFLKNYNAAWTTEASVHSTPDWNSEPSLTYVGPGQWRGGGNQRQVAIKTGFFDLSLLLKVRLRSLTDTSINLVSYFSAEDGELILGKNMCSAAFLFKNYDEYVIELTPVDAAGNEGEMKKIRVKV